MVLVLVFFKGVFKKKIHCHTLFRAVLPDPRSSFRENDGDLAHYCFSLTLVKWKRLLIKQ